MSTLKKKDSGALLKNMHGALSCTCCEQTYEYEPCSFAVDEYSYEYEPCSWDITP